MDRDAAAEDEATAAERARALAARAREVARRDGAFAEAAGLFREALAIADGGGDAAAREQAARVLTAHARMLSGHGESEAALALYAAAVARAEAAAGEPWARGRMLYALYGWGLTLWRMDREDDAAARFGRLRDVAGDGPVDDDVLAVVVRGLLLRASFLRDRGELGAAVEAYGEIVERFGDTEVALEKAAPAHLAYALMLQERARAEAGDAAGSAALCRAAIARLPPFDADDQVAGYVAALFYDLGYLLGDDLGDREGALAAWAEAVARYGDREDERIRARTGRALEASGSLLWHADRIDEALALADEVERRYGGDGEDAELRAYVALAARRRIAIQLLRGEADAVVDGARALLARFGDDPDDAVRAPAREARFDLGSALMQRGEHAEAVVVLEAFLADPGSDQATRILRARTARALAFHQGGRPDEAAAEYDALLADLDDVDDPALRSLRVTALVNAADAHARAGDEEAMFAAHRRFVAAVADDVAGAFAVLREEAAWRDPDDPATRNQIALLDLKEAATLCELEHGEAARTALRALIARCEDDALPDVAGAVAMARELLAELGDD